MVLLLLAQTAAPSGATRTPEPALLTLCRAYNVIRFEHPALVDETDGTWDEAVLAAIPTVERDPSTLTSAIATMLATLQDPLTGIYSTAEVPERQGVPTGQSTDGVRTVHLNGYPDRDDPLFSWIRGLNNALKLAPDDTALNIDLRMQGRGTPEQRAPLTDAWMSAGVLYRLVATPLVTPTIAERYFVGFPNEERFFRYTGYREGRETTGGGEFVDGSAAAAHVPITFLTDRTATLPDVALALQRTGKATIRSTDYSPIVEPGASHIENVGNGIRISVRTSAPFEPGKITVTPSLKSRFASSALPDESHRILAVFRMWGAIRYFFPYVSLMHDDWDRALITAVAQMRGVADSRTYELALMEMYAHIHDSHGVITGDATKEAYAALPALVARHIQGKPTIVQVDPAIAKRDGFAVGDVIESVDGEPAQRRLARLARYTNASTPQALFQGLDRHPGYPTLLSGRANSTITLGLRGRSGLLRIVKTLRTPTFLAPTFAHPKAGILPGNIGYVDVSRLMPGDVDAVIAQLSTSRAIVFDMRGYPNDTVNQLAPHFTRKPVNAVLFHTRQLRTPFPTDTGEFLRFPPQTRDFYETIQPRPPYLGQPVIILINVEAISQSEDMVMYFQAATHVRTVGEPTTGADGDITEFELPGNVYARFTGQAALHPNGVQFQRIGIIPNVRVSPTLRGIRAGKDEIFEAGINEARGTHYRHRERG